MILVNAREEDMTRTEKEERRNRWENGRGQGRKTNIEEARR